MNQQNCSTATALSSCQASVLEQAMKLSQENTLTTGNVYFSFLYAGIFFLFFFFFNTKIICHLRFLAWFQVLVFKLFSFLKKRKRETNNKPLSSHTSCVFWKWRQKNVQCHISQICGLHFVWTLTSFVRSMCVCVVI